MMVLERNVLDVLLPGFTHHVDIGQGEDARISYGAGGLAQMVLPGKMPMNGEWKPLQDGYQVVWSGGPEAAWKIAHDVGRLTYIDPTGREAGTVTRIEPIQAWT
ncbi:MAG: hypothetical protein EON48_00720 [Acetobacteraceae bacterium]|nr:MAG: hypothetical protein EON48_00720 [Acetobacteraceae bacterium]